MRDAAAAEIQGNSGDPVGPLVDVVTVGKLGAATAEGDVHRKACACTELRVHGPSTGKQIDGSAVIEVLTPAAKGELVHRAKGSAIARVEIAAGVIASETGDVLRSIGVAGTHRAIVQGMGVHIVAGEKQALVETPIDVDY